MWPGTYSGLVPYRLKNKYHTTEKIIFKSQSRSLLLLHQKTPEQSKPPARLFRPLQTPTHINPHHHNHHPSQTTTMSEAYERER
jgi:hypothetical protein